MGVSRGSWDQADLAVLTDDDADQLATHLLTFLNSTSIAILAPITPRHFTQLPLWLISIPKAGTHLMLTLVEAFGYKMNFHYRELPQAGGAYYLEYSNAHTMARDFFVDSVRRAPFGNRHHPFPRFPALFIYRNPLDILVSEARYYHKDGRTIFAGYFRGMSLHERLERLIDDPWFLGTIRDRVGGFSPWLEMPNVIPISFEELIGPQGGGELRVQEDLIWSLQLKLQVPGRTDALCGSVFNSSSPTFNKGHVGTHRKIFDPSLYKRFMALPQDFMEKFGYAVV